MWTNIHKAGDRSYRVLQYARIVVYFSEDRNTEELQYARLVLGVDYIQALQ